MPVEIESLVVPSVYSIVLINGATRNAGIAGKSASAGGPNEYERMVRDFKGLSGG